MTDIDPHRSARGGGLPEVRRVLRHAQHAVLLAADGPQPVEGRLVDAGARPAPHARRVGPTAPVGAAQPQGCVTARA